MTSPNLWKTLCQVKKKGGVHDQRTIHHLHYRFPPTPPHTIHVSLRNKSGQERDSVSEVFQGRKVGPHLGTMCTAILCATGIGTKKGTPNKQGEGRRGEKCLQSPRASNELIAGLVDASSPDKAHNNGQRCSGYKHVMSTYTHLNVHNVP